MGWSSGWHSRSDLIRHLTTGQESKTYRVLRHCFVGNNLWSVAEVTPPGGTPERFIRLDMIRRYRADDWGYKDVEESMGPCETSCPLAYLDMVPDVPAPYGAAWRERVRAYHARRAAIAGAAPGSVLVLRAGLRPPRLTVTRHRGRAVYGISEAGNEYLVRPRQVAEVLPF
jgi:hypothetical protein